MSQLDDAMVMLKGLRAGQHLCRGKRFFDDDLKAYIKAISERGATHEEQCAALMHTLLMILHASNELKIDFGEAMSAWSKVVKKNESTN